MNEQDFWWELRCLINSREAGKGSTHASLGYCDSFEVRQWVFGLLNPRIQGRVGFVNGAAATEWSFILFLVPGAESEEEIEWHKVLPRIPEGQWIEFDEFHKTVTINPLAACSHT